MGWSHTLWQDLEAGDRPLYAGELSRIARILGCTVRRLRGEQASSVPGFRKNGRPPAPARAELAA
jgi:hypothetical protein